jgi:hypothetical protein
MSPLDLLYDNDGSLRRRKQSSYDKSESPGISFVALLCIFSIISTIDNKLSFDKHITEKVNKANSIIGVIRLTFEYLDLKTFRMLYVSLVRPHFEYANPVWNPYLKKHIDMIENIQRRATKLIPGLSKSIFMFFNL